MKLNNLALALLTAALSPAFAYAGNDTDAIRDSFERDLSRDPGIMRVAVASLDADPLDTINISLRREPDPILASFERSFYREPIVSDTLPLQGKAGLVDVINAVLQGQEADQVSASFSRDLSHGITVCEYLSPTQVERTFLC